MTQEKQVMKFRSKFLQNSAHRIIWLKSCCTSTHWGAQLQNQRSCSEKCCKLYWRGYCYPAIQDVQKFTSQRTLIRTHPRCIIGPSGPTGIPLPTDKQHDINLITRVLMLKICLTCVPLRKPISSGIPEPVAAGLTN